MGTNEETDAQRMARVCCKPARDPELPRQYLSWKHAADSRLALLREAEHELARLRIRLAGFA